MKSITNLGILMGLLFLMLTGCGNEVKGDEKIAEEYLEQQGYQVTSQKGEVHTYILDKSKLNGGTETLPYKQSWGVQSVEPDIYFGKEIKVYRFTVKNHPLEKQYKIETNVGIMICEGQVIGGTSFPVQGKDEELIMGAPYSLDGKTLEEVTQMSFKEWSENWRVKYGN